jgi:DNA-binding NtrC family response regulator
VRTTLARLGYKIFEAEPGTGALEVWKAHGKEIDLLLTDMVLPNDLSGKDLSIHLSKENPKLKVVYMSGYSQQLKAGSPSVGETNFLAKPFNVHQLAQTIRNCLAA